MLLITKFHNFLPIVTKYHTMSIRIKIWMIKNQVQLSLLEMYQRYKELLQGAWISFKDLKILKSNNHMIKLKSANIPNSSGTNSH